MFENRFNSKKTDPLVEAVKQAQADGEIRRQAEALVNEEFGVYSRKAVVREQLAAYDARLEEAYKCMKEGEKLADKDYDKDGKIESPKDEVWGSRFRAAKMAGKMEEEQIDEISTEKLVRYRNKAGEGREKGSKLAYAKLTGKAKVKASMPKTSYMEEEQIDEVSAGLARRAAHHAFVKSDKMKKDAQKEPDMHSYVQAFHKGEKKSKQGTKFAKYAAKKMEEENLDEAAYSAKAARAGKDIGKPGKMFSKIAKKAGERYGSEERGKKVAGAILKRIRAKHMKEENLEELSAFGREFAAAMKNRKPGQTTYHSKVTGQDVALKYKSPTTTSKAPGVPSTPKPTGPQNNPGLKGATGFQRTMKTDVGDIKVSPSTPGSGYSQSAERMKAMKAPETPGSMKISSQPAPSTGPSGAEKMDTMNRLSKSTAPTPSPTPSPAPSMSMSDPKAKALKESVQVGENSYRIV